MSINFKMVTGETFKEVAMLSVKAEQKSFIEDNAYSIAESKFNDEWQTVGIYKDGLLIGFAMYGYISSEKRVWLDRFMIDKKFQGRGYGKVTIKELIESIFKKFSCKEIYLSIFEDNHKALKLYEELGFNFNGELDYGGEKVMVLKSETYFKRV